MSLWSWIVGLFSDNESTENQQKQVQSTGSQSAGSQSTSEQTSADAQPQSVQAEDEHSAEYSDQIWWNIADGYSNNYVPPPEVELSPHGRSLQKLLEEHLDGHDLSLPALPQAAEAVLSKLSSRNCDYGEVAKQIGEDQVLTASVLRLVNSSFYGGSDKITDLKPAITRLGMKSLKSLVMHYVLRSATFFAKTENNKLANEIWQRSIISGAIMRFLAQNAGTDEEHAFLIGLLHDIGNVIILRIACTQTGLHIDHIGLDEFEYLCFKYHEQFGEIIAKEWKLPEDLYTLIRDHHQYPEPNEEYRQERLMLQATNIISGLLTFGPEQNCHLLETQAIKDLQLDQQKRFVDGLFELPEQLDESLAMF